MAFFVSALRDNPELAIFLTLAVGFVIGRIRIGSFSLGNVVGTLLAGVVIGQLDIKVDPLVKIVFFDLFLFATGYKVGPQFFRGLKKNAGPQVALTIVLCVTSLVTTVTAAKIIGYDSGTAAGLMAGAFTESTVIGTAGQTIERLDLPEEEKQRQLNNIPVAYAVSYLVGTGFIVWFLSSLAPRLLKVDLKAESRKLEAAMASGKRPEPGGQSAYREWDLRAIRIGGAAPRQIAASRMSSGPSPRRACSSIGSGRTASSSMRHQARSCGPATRWSSAPGRHVMLANAASVGTEVEDRELLDFPVAAMDVVLTNKRLADLTLEELAAEHGRGIVLLKLVRGGEEIPFAPDTVLNRGDLLRLAGAKSDVERAGRALGYIERPSSETDVVFVGLGILAGGLLGLADADGRHTAAEPDGERRCAHHGPRVRLAAVGQADVRANPGAGALGLRHRRPRGLHRRRRPQRRPEFRGRTPADGPEPPRRRVHRRGDAAHHRAALRAIRPEDEPRHPLRRVLRARAPSPPRCARSRTKPRASSPSSATPYRTRSATSC